MSSPLMADIASDRVLDMAYDWVCQQRKSYPPNADIWDIRFHWPRIKQQLIHDLRQDRYLFSPNQSISNHQGKTIHLWTAQDAIVLKAMAMVLATRLPLSPRCTHVKGQGGLKGALRWVRRKLLCCANNRNPPKDKTYQFVIRTDVKGYYDSIQHEVLLKQLIPYFPEKDVQRLITQSIKRSVQLGGTYREIRRGIGRGSPLSPLYGALYLKPLDDALDQAGLSFVRYMDDILILTKTRWHNRRAMALLNQTLQSLGCEKHPDKTSIGKIARGFDFLGYHHTHAGIKPATVTYQKLVTRITQLYEQQASPERLGVYLGKWAQWVRGGLPRDWVLGDYSGGMRVIIGTMAVGPGAVAKINSS